MLKLKMLHYPAAPLFISNLNDLNTVLKIVNKSVQYEIQTNSTAQQAFPQVFATNLIFVQ